MEYALIEKVLSPARLSTYRNAVRLRLGFDCEKTSLELYKWNAELSGSLLFPLHIYEVTLRNSISEAIMCRYGDDWPNNSVFQNSLPKREKQDLLNALRNCKSVGKLLPELKLYWFESMLTKRHDGRIWKEYIHTIFPCTSEVDNLTVESLRMQLHDECEVIRKLRNRIAHHEPIFNQKKLVNILPYIRKTIGYRCAETLVWFDKYETASSLLERKAI